MRTKRIAQVAQPPTLEEIRQWPATVDVVTAGRPLGLGRNGAYDAVKTGTFPVRVLKIGTRYRVVTSELIALLDTGSTAEVIT
ncbi:DNA-binding protein [Amycolatopsis sp. NPDC051371]|uniref:DNA-binding protein n=1 Tax=Amycolatopsis sp. NPDC051371 TaxID=3155800 RepID=UPI003417FF50